MPKNMHCNKNQIGTKFEILDFQISMSQFRIVLILTYKFNIRLAELGTYTRCATGLII